MSVTNETAAPQPLTVTPPDAPPSADAAPPPPGFRRSSIRRLIESTILFLSVLLLFRAFGAEPYCVPTGSMAPALLGNHKSTACPRCGYPIDVGCKDERCLDCPPAFCRNCGCNDISLDGIPVCRGDHLLVNKNVYDFRRPRRWEMAVFRCPADPQKAFVKRVVGLPGEAVQIRGGDVWIDDELARKTLAEFKALRIPVFDNNYQPPGGWACRWLPQPDRGRASLDGTRLRFETLDEPDRWHWLAYCHWLLDANKAAPIRDEYSYNGNSGRKTEAVHDFLLECDVQVQQGDGWVGLGITDGLDHLVAELPAGTIKGGARLVDDPPGTTPSSWPRVFRVAPDFVLEPGRRYHVELAFVDRRATLAVDGRVLFTPLDRPAAENRPEVERPAKVGARGADVAVSNVRLWRDVHYTASGHHAVRSPVRLGAGQYFVLGDNSPNSDDSRFWSDANGGPLPVPEGWFLGKPFLVHLPSRWVRWRDQDHQAIDWGRVRWLR